MHFRNICNTPFLTLDGAIRPRLIWYMNLAKDTLVIDLQRASALDRHLRYVKACLAAISEKLPLIRSLEIVGSPNDWYEFCHFTQIFDEYKLDWDRARGLEKIRGVIKVSRLRDLLNQYDHPRGRNRCLEGIILEVGLTIHPSRWPSILNGFYRNYLRVDMEPGIVLLVSHYTENQLASLFGNLPKTPELVVDVEV